MKTLELTDEEIAMLTAAMEAAIASAQRAQKTGKMPEITQVFKIAEAKLSAMRVKLLQLGNSVAPSKK